MSDLPPAITSAAPAHPAEDELRAAFSRGAPLNLNRLGKRHMRHGRPERDIKRVIDAEVLRDLLLSVASPGVHPQPLMVIGADVHGSLDLQFAKIDHPIRMEDCWFYGPVELTEAELRSVSLRDSTAEQGVRASHLRVTGDVMLDGLSVFGPLRLGGAHFEDDLHLAGAAVYQPHVALGAVARGARGKAADGAGGAAAADRALLDLENAQVKGNLVASQLYVEGTVAMDGAAVGGTVRMRDAEMGCVPEMSPGRRRMDAWSGDGIEIAHELDASGLWALGPVRLIDAHMQSLVLTGAHVDYCGASPALVMDRLQCAGSVFCDEEIYLAGGMTALGIKVGASFYLGRGKVRAPPSPGPKRWAVSLQRARIGDDLTCEAKFQPEGIFDIASAKIGGTVDLSGATMSQAEGSDSEIAFDAGRAHIGGNLNCVEFKGDSSCVRFACYGSMALQNAKVDGWVKIHERSGTNYPLAAGGLSAGRDVNLIKTRGRVVLRGARAMEGLTVDVGGLSDAGDKPAADLGAVTARVLTINGRQRGLLDLGRASVQLLHDDPSQWSPRRLVPFWVPLWIAERVGAWKSRLCEQRRLAAESPLVLDGLTYENIIETGAREKPADRSRDTTDRLVWLHAGSQVTESAGRARASDAGACPRPDPLGFVPQPYQQLAAVYRRIGRDSDARDVLHAMYCRRNGAIYKGSHHALWLWNAIQNLALGYGYRPKRAFGWIILLATLTTAWIILFDNQAHIGVVSAAILSLGLALPGSGLDKIEHMVEMSTLGHLFALILVLAGLALGATVIAAIGRVIRN